MRQDPFKGSTFHVQNSDAFIKNGIAMHDIGTYIQSQIPAAHPTLVFYFQKLH